MQVWQLLKFTHNAFINWKWLDSVRLSLLWKINARSMRQRKLADGMLNNGLPD